jgi:hypothetical protein
MKYSPTAFCWFLARNPTLNSSCTSASEGKVTSQDPLGVGCAAGTLNAFSAPTAATGVHDGVSRHTLCVWIVPGSRDLDVEQPPAHGGCWRRRGRFEMTMHTVLFVQW